MVSNHDLNQCWNIVNLKLVNLKLRNKLQWNTKQNLYIFIKKIVFENVVCEMAAICLNLNVLTLNAQSHIFHKR